MRKLLILLFLLCVGQGGYIVYTHDYLYSLVFSFSDNIDSNDNINNVNKEVVNTIILNRWKFVGKFLTYGKIKAKNNTIIKIPGVLANFKSHIKDIFFTSGQNVKKGDLLLSISCDELLHRKNAAYKEYLQHAQYLKRAITLKNEISEYELESAKLKAEKSKHEYNQALSACEKLNLKSPFDGVIGHPNVVSGEVISGEKNVAILVNPYDLIVEFYVPADHNHLETGTSVMIESYDGESFSEAIIVGVDPFIDDLVGKIKVIAELKFAPESFKHNSNVNVSIDKKPIYEVYSIPKSAVIDDISNCYVCKVEKRNGEYYTKLCKVQVVDSKKDRYAIISEYVEDGDKIIVEGMIKQDNIPVTPKDFNYKSPI